MADSPARVDYGPCYHARMDDIRAQALAFLKSHHAGSLATLSPDATTPRVRLVYYAADDAFNIYFLTLVTTRKAWDLKEHGRVAFAISREDVPQTLQIEGAVVDITEEATADDESVKQLFGNLASNSRYYAPIARMDQADVRYYRLTPSWIRFGDFTSGTHTDAVMHDIAPASSAS